MKYTKHTLLTLFLILSAILSKNLIAAERSCVILLHGLARSHMSMLNMEYMLKRHHYIVVNQSYPSTSKSINELANTYIPLMITQCEKHHARHINFVTHSLGGIVLQKYFQTHHIAGLERIIMLSPPNHGSPVADLLHRNWLYYVITGPVGQELTTDIHSTPNQLHLDNHYQIGVIAGSASYIPFSRYIFCEPNDGLVAISSAKTRIMKDFIVLPVNHTFIMNNEAVQKQVLYFLGHGSFVKPYS